MDGDLRNADTSLQGFFYQFDKTIIEILENEEGKENPIYSFQTN